MDNIFIGVCLAALVLYFSSSVENYTKANKDATVGETLRTIDLRFAFPNIVPLRKQINTWIVNVPLTPFRAPFVMLPKDEDVPNFLLYNLSTLSKVRNQGDCGACWAFSVCNMLSDRLAIMTGGAFNENLSVQQLLSCFDRNGCDGGSPEDAMLWLQDKSKKLTTESVFPFKNAKGGAIKPCNVPPHTIQVGVEPASVKSIVQYIPEQNYNEQILQTNIENMKRELAYYGPFYCAMTVYADFFSYSGLIPYTPDPKAEEIGGHAIEIVGFCDKGVDPRPHYRDVGYWICRNSWGKDWPLQVALNGYFTIVMGKNICGIESRCGSGIPQLFGSKPISKQVELDKLRTTTFTKI